MEKRISKCGARYTHKKEVEILHNEKSIKQEELNKPEKKTPQRRIFRKVSEKIGNDFPANIEDENLDGVSV